MHKPQSRAHDKLANRQVWGRFDDATPACWADLAQQRKFEVFRTPVGLTCIWHARDHSPYDQLVVICHGPGTMIYAYDVSYVCTYEKLAKCLITMYVQVMSTHVCIHIYMFVRNMYIYVCVYGYLCMSTSVKTIMFKTFRSMPWWDALKTLLKCENMFYAITVKIFWSMPWWDAKKIFLRHRNMFLYNQHVQNILKYALMGR